MKAVYKAGHRGSFITSTLAPTDRTQERHFNWGDAAAFFAAVFVLVIVIRLILAH